MKEQLLGSTDADDHDDVLQIRNKVCISREAWLFLTSQFSSCFSRVCSYSFLRLCIRLIVGELSFFIYTSIKTFGIEFPPINCVPKISSFVTISIPLLVQIFPHFPAEVQKMRENYCRNYAKPGDARKLQP